jgi:hypothetical protein
MLFGVEVDIPAWLVGATGLMVGGLVVAVVFYMIWLNRPWPD